MVVHSASLQDRVAAPLLLTRLFCRIATVRTVFADAGYTGPLIEWARKVFGHRIEIVPRTRQHRFEVLPKRWVVERTFAWLGWSRRLSKDYELLPESAETMIHIAAAHLLLRKLA